MPSAETIAAFAAASLVLLLIPGPAVVYIVNRSVRDGRPAGLAAVAGVTTANMMHAIAAAAGLTAVIRTSQTAFNVVKWLGAGYLIFVGVKTLLRPAAELGVDQPSMPAHASYLQGVVVNIFNPKVALFFLSYLPTFIHPDDGSAGRQALVLGLIFVGMGACTDSCYALVASSMRHVLLRGRTLPFVRRWVSGAVFIALGLLAASSSAKTTKATT